MKHLVLLLCLSLSTLSLAAQKYGHVNFTNVLSEIPGTKTAEKQLEAYNQQQIQKGEQMVADFDAAVKSAEAKQPVTPPVEFQKIRQQLEAQRNEIVQFEQRMSYSLEGKRKELLGPLIQQVKDAVKAVAEENNYQLVFDTSVFNAILFAAESDDLTSLVRTKLGVQ